MKVIVISVHPDDEVLGCGGTLLKHLKNGDEVGWLIITNTSEKYGFPKERVNARSKEVEEVNNIYKFVFYRTLDYKPGYLTPSDLTNLISDISKVFNDFKPETIYLPNRSDAHSDHRITFDAAISCTKSFRYPYLKKVLMYECISETEFAPSLPEKMFIPNYFVDISEFIERKLESMMVYSSEMGEHPFPRSLDNIKALAHFRGASVGVKYAEAFQLLKFIDK